MQIVDLHSNASKHLKKIRKRDEYGTDPDLFEKTCKKEKIKLEIDYAGSFYNHVLKRYFTKDVDSLQFEWYEDGFGNWPYSRIEEFMKKTYESWKKYNITMLILCYVKTDTKWWNSYVYDQKNERFIPKFIPIEGRLKFRCSHGYMKKDPSPYPSCFLLYKKKNKFLFKLETILKRIRVATNSIKNDPRISLHDSASKQTPT